MNGLFAAAADVQQVCQGEGWCFCFIGGLAVQRWGEPRMTRDVDLTLLTGYGAEAPFVARLLESFTSRVNDAEDFARRARVLLLRHGSGVPIDVSLGALPFEERTVSRASPWVVPDSAGLVTCSAEDLVVHKVFAGRDRDWPDVDGILARQAGRLDVALIVEELTPLLEVKGAIADLDRLRRLVAQSDR